jgi:peptidoglycan/LPS O-acetylase OafA/YrhL
MSSEHERSSIWSSAGHVPELDGVRGLAILLVTIYRFAKDLPYSGSFGSTLHSVVELVSRGVDLFFVLSGFLITGILVDSKHEPKYFANFYIRRTLRIFPLYYASLLLFLIVLPWIITNYSAFEPAIQQQGYLWAYLSNVQMAIQNSWCFGPMDHFWSLAVEEHFYLVWPLVIYWLSPKAAFRACLLLAIVSAVARVACCKYFDARVAADVLTVFRLEGLCLGAALALWLRISANAQKTPVPWLIAAVATLGALLMALSGRSLYSFGHSLWAVAFVGFLALIVTSTRGGILSRVLSLPALRHFGKYSYAMYVFQNPLIPLMSGIASAEVLAAWTGESILSSLLHVAILFVATWGCALASWYLLERHCIALKHRFASQPKSTSDHSSILQGATHAHSSR